MNLLDGLKVNNTVKNSKGGNYYLTSYNDNLDLFTRINRFNSEDDIIDTFKKALNEDTDLALANLLYILDIRSGKGERRIFKVIYKYLCENEVVLAQRILPFISKLGRYDYILEGINTPFEEETISLIKKQLELDLKSDSVSLLAKWLPSHRTHNKNNSLAKDLMRLLNMSEREYRKTLSNLRSKINIVEKNITNNNYENIIYSEVPTKAMLKYSSTFGEKDAKRYNEFKEAVKSGNTKVNTDGLFVYEIVKKYIQHKDVDLLDLMWNNQKNILEGNKENLLVVADTSGSMRSHDCLPICTSIGLAMYIAERNEGIFKNHFITFSENPELREIKGNTIKEKLDNFNEINARNTNIDKVFVLLLKTARENNLNQSELPSKIIIVSDMEFDYGVDSMDGTNFHTWKKLFQESGYNLPTIIFWNVAGNSKGLPVTKFDNDVAMVSGFSTSILDNLLTLENYTPIDIMLEKLEVYVDMLNKEE